MRLWSFFYERVEICWSFERGCGKTWFDPKFVYSKFYSALEINESLPIILFYEYELEKKKISMEHRRRRIEL